MLTVGQRIVRKVRTVDGLQEDEWLVLELLNQKNHAPRVRIRVEKISYRMRKYLTLGKEYVLRQHSATKAWVVPSKQCKATSSQVILYDWPNDSGASIDIDC